MVSVPTLGDGAGSLVFINNQPSKEKAPSCQHMSDAFKTNKSILHFNTKKRVRIVRYKAGHLRYLGTMMTKVKSEDEKRVYGKGGGGEDKNHVPDVILFEKTLSK